MSTEIDISDSRLYTKYDCYHQRPKIVWWIRFLTHLTQNSTLYTNIDNYDTTFGIRNTKWCTKYDYGCKKTKVVCFAQFFLQNTQSRAHYTTLNLKFKIYHIRIIKNNPNKGKHHIYVSIYLLLRRSYWLIGKIFLSLTWNFFLFHSRLFSSVFCQ